MIMIRHGVFGALRWFADRTTPLDRSAIRFFLRTGEILLRLAWKHRAAPALFLCPILFLLAWFRSWDPRPVPASLACAALAAYAAFLALDEWIQDQDALAALCFVIGGAEIVLVLALRWFWWFR
jgi:hypothetical protein